MNLADIICTVLLVAALTAAVIVLRKGNRSCCNCGDCNKCEKCGLAEKKK